MRKPRIWTIEEDAFLAENILKLPIKEIAKKLRVGDNTVYRRASKKNLPRRLLKRFWAKSDIERLLLLLPRYSNAEIAAQLGRSYRSVAVMANKLGIWGTAGKPVEKRKWTVSDDAFLKKYYSKRPMAKIAKKLGRTMSSVHHRAWGMHLSSPFPKTFRDKNFITRPLSWTDQRLAILKKYFPIESNAAVAKRLGKANSTIARKAKELGLKKSIYVKRR